MLPGASRRSPALVLTAAAALLLSAPAAPAAARTTGVVAACPAAGMVSQHPHSGHNGVDIANAVGTPIHAVDGGEVTISGHESGYGQWIRIQRPDGRISPPPR
ncbi:M23 family metallopeptidase [Streptomyces sp. NPDC054865]